MVQNRRNTETPNEQIKKMKLKKLAAKHEQ